MKRPIFASGALVPAMALIVGGAGSGCSAPERAAQPPTAGTGGWVSPPMIESVERGRVSLIVRGGMAPLGRVVLRSAGDTAYAAGADERGRFELRVQPPAADALFIVETRTGQDAAPAPYRMLASRDPAGPIALLAPGAASRRLDPAGPLDVIDSDGRALLASGRTSPGAVATISVGGGPATEARAGADGRWTQTLAAPGNAATDIVVGGRRYFYPGPGDGDPVLERVQGGWRSSWSLSPGSRQSSWFPDAG